MKPNLWLFIHFPKLALESWFTQSDQPVPQLLLAPGTKEVMQCNSLASQAGVKVGMKVSTATCLLQQVEIANFDPQTEKEALERLAILCYRFSAQISVDESGLLLEAGSMLKLFRGIRNYWHALHKALAKSGYSFVCSAAHTPVAAKVLAQNEIEFCSRNPVRVRDILDQLSIFQIGLNPKHAARLDAMGLSNYKLLRAAPKKELGYRFGRELLQQLLDLENSDHQGNSFELPPRFFQSIHLLHEVELAQGLIFPISRILQTLEQYLLARQLVSESLFIKLEHREISPTMLHIQAVQGLKYQKDWQHLLAIRLEQTQLPKPVIGIRVRAHRFSKEQHQSGDLLGYQFPQEDSDRLLAFLIARLGHDKVKRPFTTADPRPERAGLLVSPTNQEELDTEFPNAKKHPIFRLERIREIQPEHYDIKVEPERIVSGWWDENRIYRADYFIAQHKHTGQWHWLSRNDTGFWRLAGVFA